jgi:GTP-binding protein HflX
MNRQRSWPTGWKKFGMDKDKLIITKHDDVETVLLIGVCLDRFSDPTTKESLDELAQLCETAGARVVESMICRISRRNSAMFIGDGKAAEIAALVKERKIATVVFDEELSPAQGRNLEKVIGTKVIDRTQVILDIFAQHARTAEGRLQIELAQLEYLLPRLRRMWTHLERQKGGIGMHGPGEKQLELDRRRIVEDIQRHRKRLQEVRGRRSEQRRGRRRHGWALISLVGYTNAGKSTLINALTQAGVLAYDKLFATLDPTTRQLKLPNNQLALLTDTVGFIRKLPHHLVESFKATLEEVVEADILIHIMDAAHPQVLHQIDAVNQVLTEIGVHDKIVLPVFNKLDDPAALRNLVSLRAHFPDAVEISALTGTGLDHLREHLADLLRNRSVNLSLSIPIQEGKLLAMLKTHGSIHSIVYEDDHVLMEASVPVTMLGACEPFRLHHAGEEERA